MDERRVHPTKVLFFSYQVPGGPRGGKGAGSVDEEKKLFFILICLVISPSFSLSFAFFCFDDMQCSSS